MPASLPPPYPGHPRLPVPGPGRRHVPPPGGRGPGARPGPADAPSFATVAALLTGPWRVNDPVAFAAAMRAAPLVAGYPVVDLCACARQPTVGLDPLSAAMAGHLEAAVGAAAGRSALDVRWVAARRWPLPLRGGRRPGPGRRRGAGAARAGPPGRTRRGRSRHRVPRPTTTRGSWSSWATGAAAWPASAGRRCPASHGRRPAPAGVRGGRRPCGAASCPARARRSAGPPRRPGPGRRRARRRPAPSTATEAVVLPFRR